MKKLTLIAVLSLLLSPLSDSAAGAGFPGKREKALRDALLWLSRHQRADGSWEGKKDKYDL